MGQVLSNTTPPGISPGMPPGWYAEHDGWERRWDGAAWTAERRLVTQQTPFAPADEATRVRPKPPPPPRSHVPLIVVLVAVFALLAAGVGVLAALSPWASDEPAATPSRDGGAHAVPIQGDLDGDGHGDAVFYFRPDFQSMQRITASSNGTVFTTTQLAVEPSDEPDQLSLDWNADGISEALTWAFAADARQLTVTTTGEAQAFALPFSVLGDHRLEIQVQGGDFDGDGTADLAVAGQHGRTVDVLVLAGDGAGHFAEPVRWASLDNATMDSTELRSGDFDHDGDSDLWAQLPAEKVTDEAYTGYYSGRQGFALLTSTGSEFTVGAVSENDIYADAYLIGDVTGDGTSSLVTVDAHGSDQTITVQAYDLSSGKLQPIQGFAGTSTIGQRNLEGATLSDVDGDGRGDIVFVVKSSLERKFTGVQVMRSTGTGFESAMVWAETPVCADTDCEITFPGSR